MTKVPDGLLVDVRSLVPSVVAGCGAILVTLYHIANAKL